MERLIRWVDAHTETIRRVAHLLVILSTLLVVLAFFAGGMTGQDMSAWTTWWLLNLAMFFVIQYGLREED